MPIVAETERLILRTWEARHEQPYQQFCNTGEVMNYLGGVQDPWEVSEDIRWFERCYEEFGYTLWVLEERATQRFLGFCGLDHLRYEVPDHLVGEVEIGWRLRHDAWGRGFATEAAQAVLDMAFFVRGLLRVISRADEQNSASVSIMEKLDMTPSVDPKPAKGEKLYAVDRQAWLKRRGVT
ncbi:GNAT family N-acetyltransferase [Parafrankia sp. BMG5.11]|uniref:GNAT family N-acetyltransferase n=1 Tax=Parafrankia sp. BMG5.11 TaxID=222540 RepID=UPI0010393CB1|nr:GNAT family N-acetyltransferase [Parafrankia sp. BMG5.11]TCJ41276.1 N-acetyltransferase [Parafrankia sp. BMG5.11]